MAPRILGIDPGTQRLGWGVLQAEPRPTLIDAGVCSAPAREEVSRRLVLIQAQLRVVFETQGAEIVALESSFHGKNAQAMLRLGEARGMIIGLAGSLGLEVVDYAPAQIKKAVTGRGNASKEAVAQMVRALLLPRTPSASGSPLLESTGHDLTDALAVALCHAHRARYQALLRPGPRPPRVTG